VEENSHRKILKGGLQMKCMHTYKVHGIYWRRRRGRRRKRELNETMFPSFSDI
jgi:hypothetical protein